MSPEIIAHLDAIKVNMNEAGMNTINIVLAFVMFGVALGIKPKTFVDIIIQSLGKLSVFGFNVEFHNNSSFVNQLKDIFIFHL